MSSEGKHTQHQYRRLAVGQAISKKSKSRQITQREVSVVKPKEGTNRKRVGQPSRPYLGKRTMTQGGRRKEGLEYFFERTDPAAGSEQVPGFEQNEAAYAIFLRIFIKPIRQFFDDWRLNRVARHFVLTHHLNGRMTTFDLKKRCYQIRNDFGLMKQAVLTYGPAFLPLGTVVVNNVVEHVHRIPIKDGSLMFAQQAFFNRNQTWLPKQSLPIFGLGPRRRNKKAGKDNKDASANASDDGSGQPSSTASNSSQGSKSSRKSGGSKQNQGGGEKDGTPQLTPEVIQSAKYSNSLSGFDTKTYRFTSGVAGLTVHRFSLDDEEFTEQLNALNAVDCLGAPFCGHTCVEIAAGRTPEINALVRDCQHFTRGDVAQYGSFQFLDERARLLGFGLMVVIKISEITDTRDLQYILDQIDIRSASVYGDYVVTEKSANPPSENFIVLKHTGSLNYGHYLLMTMKKPVTVQSLPVATYPKLAPYFFEFREEMEISHTYIDKEQNKDLRSPLVRAEPIKVVDSYSLVKDKLMFYINPFFLRILVANFVLLWFYCLWFWFIRQPLPPRDWNGFFIQQIAQLTMPLTGNSYENNLYLVKWEVSNFWFQWGMGPQPERFQYPIRIDWRWWYFTVHVVLLHLALFYTWLSRQMEWEHNFSWSLKTILFEVSNNMVRSIDSYAQVSSELNLDTSVFSRFKFFSTNCSRDHITRNSRYFANHLLKYAAKYSPNVVNTVGMQAYNTANRIAYIPPATLQNVRELQVKTQGQGTGNYVIDVKFGNPEKERRPIAEAPIGTIQTNIGPVGPGDLPITDTIGVLVAFCSRSMSKNNPQYTTPEFVEFLNFSKSALMWFVDQCDFSTIEEEEPTVFFSRHYAGKRSRMWIEGAIEQYRKYCDGSASINYDRHSCFVKLENSLSSKGFRPRLIMTMSPVMLFDCCQVIKVIDIWNAGPFSRYQVKDIEPLEMIKKIVEVTNCSHSVTDYSSFEASITGQVRTVENFIIQQMLERAGLTNTLRSFNHYAIGPRTLYSNGVTMQIDTRCSGDIWTSFGNALVNWCLVAYSAHKKGEDFRTLPVLVEGDDGIAPTGMLDESLVSKLGFSYSDEVSGHFPGDTDFLRCRWINGKKYLNVGRALSVFWVKGKCNLKRSSKLFLLRCMGCSLHHMSPGHPILWAIVQRIGRDTTKAKKFPTWMMHLDLYKWQIGSDFDPDRYPFQGPDEEMRLEVANGALGFPPIPIDNQLAIEHAILNDPNMYIGDLLGNYSEVLYYVQSLEENDDPTVVYSESVLELLRIFAWEPQNQNEVG